MGVSGMFHVSQDRPILTGKKTQTKSGKGVSKKKEETKNRFHSHNGYVMISSRLAHLNLHED